MSNSLKRLIGNRNPLRLLWHRGKGLLAALLCGFPARYLTVIGVTGTDGKTTTVGMVAHILRNAGFKTALLSTALVSTGGPDLPNELQKTSPSPLHVQKFLRQSVRSGCTHVVLEYSSHGLVQGRLLGTFPDIAAITNTSEEHLDYHGTMDRYRSDKGILFRMLRGKGTKVLNRDDATFALYEEIPSTHTVSYSMKSPEATLTLSNVAVTRE